MADCVDQVTVTNTQTATQTVVQRAPVVVPIRSTATTTVRVNSPVHVTTKATALQTVRENSTTVRVEVGPQGPPGETEGATIGAVAGETIHGRRVAMMIDGVVFHPDILTPTDAGYVVGVTTMAGNTGDTIIVRTGGKLQEDGWSWDAGPVYCGADGVLTQSPGAAGWLLVVGTALDATTILVNLGLPIQRV